MKAGYGIVFKEGDHHVDRGPPVSDLMKQSGMNYKYSLTEYSRLAGQPKRSSMNVSNISDRGPNYARNSNTATIQLEQL